MKHKKAILVAFFFIGFIALLIGPPLIIGVGPISFEILIVERIGSILSQLDCIVFENNMVKSPPTLGDFDTVSMNMVGLTLGIDGTPELRMIFSTDIRAPHHLVCGMSGLSIFVRNARNAKDRINGVYRRLSEGRDRNGFYKNATGEYYNNGDIIFKKSSDNAFSMVGWELVQSVNGKQLKPYWDTLRAQDLLRSIPRFQESVVVIVRRASARFAGMGSSIRSAVSAALPGDSPFPSSDITQLSVSTHGAYRLHEVNADVFSDDLAFIRTTLTKLEHLDLSQARFYNDTVPISAFDCSSNIEYAFNLPKGKLPQLARIDLPPSVISVDWYAFRNLRALRSIHLPNVRYIAGQAFEGCLSLDAVHLPDVESIGQGAFFRCESLKGLVLPRLRQARFCAFADSGIEAFAVPHSASLDTQSFSQKRGRRWYQPPLQGLLLLEDKSHNKETFRFERLTSPDVFCNTPLDLSDFPPGSRQSGYVLPSLQPQWPATVFHLKTGEAVTLPVQFKNPCVSPGWVWGNSDNPRGAVFESGILKAVAPGEATVTVTGMTAAVTLQGAQMEHTFSNWPVPMHEPVQIKVTVQAQ